jgi:fidgetin-like protein 1
LALLEPARYHISPNLSNNLVDNVGEGHRHTSKLDILLRLRLNARLQIRTPPNSHSPLTVQLGESEKLVRALFTLAKAFSPSIIFVDEIDSLLTSRSGGENENEASRRLKTEFLIQWSSLASAAAARESEDSPRVLVLAATNLPWAIDDAARRRFVLRQYIPLPEAETRSVQFGRLLSRQHHTMTEEQLEQLVAMTDGTPDKKAPTQHTLLFLGLWANMVGFSGSDITALTKDAAMGPLRSLGEALLTTKREEIRPIDFDDFVTSLRKIRPSVSKASLQAFEKWNDDFGSKG